MKNCAKQTGGQIAKWLLICVLSVWSAMRADAATGVVLNSGNSTVGIDPYTQAGVNQWHVDGINALSKQWFWYRVGSNPEQPISAIGAPVITPINAYSAKLVYTMPGLFDIQVTYTLQGGQAGSGTADLSEQIRINNLSANPLDFHFYQFSDFNLGLADSLVLSQNLLGKFYRAAQSSGPVSLQETVVSPGASHGEAGLGGFTLGRLNDGLATTLNDNANAVGDVTWAFQWDSQIAAGGSFVIGKDKRLVVAVPEPTTVALAGLGLALLLGAARRRLG